MMSINALAQSVVNNPLLPSTVVGERGVDYASEMLNNFLGLFLIAIFLLFFGYLILGAIQWIMAGGDKGKVETARGRVTTAVIGIAVVFSAWAIVALLETVFGISILTMDISSFFLNDQDHYNVVENPYFNTPSRDVTGASYSTALVSTLIILAMVVGAVVFFLMFVIGGIQWISSGGDKGKMESARSKITNALIGFVIMLAIWAIVSLLGAFFDLELFQLNFAEYYLGG